MFETDVPFWLIVFHVLLGVAFGFCFRVLILLPAFGLIVIEAILIGARAGWSTGLIMAVVLIVALQIGYLVALPVDIFLKWLSGFVRGDADR